MPGFTQELGFAKERQGSSFGAEHFKTVGVYGDGRRVFVRFSYQFRI